MDNKVYKKLIKHFIEIKPLSDTSNIKDRGFILTQYNHAKEYHIEHKEYDVVCEHCNNTCPNTTTKHFKLHKRIRRSYWEIRCDCGQEYSHKCSNK